MKKIFNRPLTPHLTIYSSQYTSIYSIWHRITGMVLILSLIFYVSLLKIISYDLFNNSLTFLLYINIWFQNVIFLNITFFFIFHTLNGLRHILWDLGFLLSIQSIFVSTILIPFILLFYLFYILLKILS